MIKHSTARSLEWLRAILFMTVFEAGVVGIMTVVARVV